nr:hypothetical protein [uncultured Flavobacterium sp.]
MKKILYTIVPFLSFINTVQAQPYHSIHEGDIKVCSGRADNYAGDLSKNSDLTAEMIALMRNAYYRGCMDQRTKNTTDDLNKKAISITR